MNQSTYQYMILWVTIWVNSPRMILEPSVLLRQMKWVTRFVTHPVLQSSTGTGRLVLGYVEVDFTVWKSNVISSMLCSKYQWHTKTEKTCPFNRLRFWITGGHGYLKSADSLTMRLSPAWQWHSSSSRSKTRWKYYVIITKKQCFFFPHKSF